MVAIACEPGSMVCGIGHVHLVCRLRMGFVWYVINTSYSLYIVTPYLVNMDTLPSSAVLTTLIKDVGNSSNVSDSAAMLESCGKGSLATYLPLHGPPLAMHTFLTDTRYIGRPNFFLPSSLR